MGYQVANQQMTPGFLAAVTDLNTQMAREGYEGHVLVTADEFVEHYCKSNIWQINQDNMEAYHINFVGKP